MFLGSCKDSGRPRARSPEIWRRGAHRVSSSPRHAHSATTSRAAETTNFDRIPWCTRVVETLISPHTADEQQVQNTFDLGLDAWETLQSASKAGGAEEYVLRMIDEGEETVLLSCLRTCV